MLKVGINGLGRIGRAILRRNLELDAFDIVAINDINPDIGNIAYTINFDTIYGRLSQPFKADGDKLISQGRSISVSCRKCISEVNWRELGVDVVIDASGVQSNVLAAHKTIEKMGLERIFVTHSPGEDSVDFTMVLGANHIDFNPQKHRVVASSICDATALAPVLKVLHEMHGIKMGAVTTLHPWLNYQNLMDGPASSWSVPGEIYHHYALGRSSIGNVIPKPTSAMAATCKVISGLDENQVASFSYRTPAAIVGSADITLVLDRAISKSEVVDHFMLREANQEWQVFHNNLEPLVSLDFVRSPYSAIIDHRWTEVVSGSLLKLVLWYDNEWGYASRVIDQVIYSHNLQVAGE